MSVVEFYFIRVVSVEQTLPHTHLQPPFEDRPCADAMLGTSSSVFLMEPHNHAVRKTLGLPLHS